MAVIIEEITATVIPLEAAGEPQKAAEAFRAALELYQQKGDTVMAERARERLYATGSA